MYDDTCELGDNSGYWSDMAARVSRSSGRMSLHVMRLREGKGERDVVIPLRRATSEVPDALKRIAAGVDVLEPMEVQEMIDSVLKEGDMTEIH